MFSLIAQLSNLSQHPLSPLVLVAHGPVHFPYLVDDNMSMMEIVRAPFTNMD